MSLASEHRWAFNRIKELEAQLAESEERRYETVAMCELLLALLDIFKAEHA